MLGCYGATTSTRGYKIGIGSKMAKGHKVCRAMVLCWVEQETRKLGKEERCREPCRLGIASVGYQAVQGKDGNDDGLVV